MALLVSNGPSVRLNKISDLLPPSHISFSLQTLPPLLSLPPFDPATTPSVRLTFFCPIAAAPLLCWCQLPSSLPSVSGFILPFLSLSLSHSLFLSCCRYLCTAPVSHARAIVCCQSCRSPVHRPCPG